MADGDASRFIGGPQARQQAWRGFMTVAGCWAMNGYGMFSVIEKSTGDWLGRVGPWFPADWPAAEVGWGLVPAAQGKGYAVEAATATIDWVFEALGWTEVIHCIDPQNTASQNVARRLGSRLLRRQHLPPPYQELEVDVWGQSRETWRSRQTA